MKKGSIHEVEILRYAFGGKGIAEKITEQGNFIMFIPHVIPGQIAQVRVIKKKKKYAECQLLEVLKPSSLEIEIPYQPISGAPYIKVPIKTQQQWKKDSTFDVFQKIADIKHPDEKFDTFISSPEIHHYRNKMEYSFSSIGHDLLKNEEFDGFALGFKRRGTWWKVENLDKESGLFDAELENNIHKIREYCFQTRLPAWHPPKKEGFFRHLVVRRSIHQNQLLINLITSSNGIKNFDLTAFTAFTTSLLGEKLAGLSHVINDDVADRAKIENGESTLLYGKDFILEKILGLNFKISMESFFQTNPVSAEKLYRKAISYFKEDLETENAVILDLFCGTGTIGQILASQLKKAKIIGVDIVNEAIEDARMNSKLNKIENIDFFAADVGKFLMDYPEYNNKISGIILDPPRAGIAPKSLLKVMELNAKRIVYISCNPATQARDIKTMEANGYKMKKFSLVDQFPHTAHIESVVVFDKIETQ